MAPNNPPHNVSYLKKNSLYFYFSIQLYFFGLHQFPSFMLYAINLIKMYSDTYVHTTPRELYPLIHMHILHDSYVAWFENDNPYMLIIYFGVIETLQ